MHFYRRLYVSPFLEKKKRQVIWKLKTHKIMPSVYIITLADNQDLMEIYHNSLLKQPYYRKNPPYILGVAESYNAAVELVKKILIDVKASTGKYDIKNFCLNS